MKILRRSPQTKAQGCEQPRGHKQRTLRAPQYTTVLVGPDETNYLVRSYVDERVDGTWIGWIEFHPTDLAEPVLKTGQETSQTNPMEGLCLKSPLILTGLQPGATAGK